MQARVIARKLLERRDRRGHVDLQFRVRSRRRTGVTPGDGGGGHGCRIPGRHAVVEFSRQLL